MLHYQFGKPARHCDQISRRQALRLGSSGLIGGLSLPLLLELQAKAASPIKQKAQACIMLFLEGGPSTIDMWDMKPDAPMEIRGPYKPIKTNVPGTWVGEHCHRSAKVADKFTILRNHSHKDNGHTTGYHYMMTGRKPNFKDGQNNKVPTNLNFPSIGSFISSELGPRGSVPAHINIPNPMRAGGPGFLGAKHAPFVIESDPVQPDFKVNDVTLVEGVTRKRMALRNRLLTGLEQGQRKIDRRMHQSDKGLVVGRAETMSTYYQKAYDLITSPDAKRAFDINSESAQTRKAYGHTSLGQCALLARRLVESGCRFVGVDHGSWDTHFTCFPSLENDLIPHADAAFSALVTDLEQRGLLDSTLVVMMGEMGRTPRINKKAGRDHWSMAQSVLFAGGGIKPGQVIGATDKHAAYPTADPVGIEDILFTIFHLMGIDPKKEYKDALGRPVPIVNGGKLIRALV